MINVITSHWRWKDSINVCQGCDKSNDDFLASIFIPSHSSLVLKVRALWGDVNKWRLLCSTSFNTSTQAFGQSDFFGLSIQSKSYTKIWLTIQIYFSKFTIQFTKLDCEFWKIEQSNNPIRQYPTPTLQIRYIIMFRGFVYECVNITNYNGWPLNLISMLQTMLVSFVVSNAKISNTYIHTGTCLGLFTNGDI